jgi:hypothetical protein
MFSSNDIPIDAVRQAACRPEVLEAMQSFYEEVGRRIAAEKPTCWNRGACCRFGEYGHRLYVTALEVAYYLAWESREALKGPGLVAGERKPPVANDASQPESPERAAEAISLPLANPSANPSLALEHGSRNPSLALGALTDACPHAYDSQCHARDRRPLGCRIFYCDPNAQGWQGPLTEECLQELKRLHWELDVPYFYADWMTVLRCLHDTGSGAG